MMKKTKTTRSRAVSVMTGTQLEALLISAGSNPYRAARLLGIDPRTMRRYTSGESRIPLLVVCAARWIASQGMTATEKAVPTDTPPRKK